MSIVRIILDTTVFSEILRRLTNSNKLGGLSSSDTVSDFASYSSFAFSDTVYEFCVDTLTNINIKTLMELNTLDIYPKLKVNYELNIALINFLVEFHALVSEDFPKHLKELHVMLYHSLTSSKGENEINVANNYRLENKFLEFTYVVRQLVIGQHQQINVANKCLSKTCGICTYTNHPTNACLTLQESVQGA
ncbi:hypothetical protein CR513_07128, partial [Mucuna pruriens]